LVQDGLQRRPSTHSTGGMSNNKSQHNLRQAWSRMERDANTP